jgi:hypothetical protein
MLSGTLEVYMLVMSAHMHLFHQDGRLQFHRVPLFVSLYKYPMFLVVFRAAPVSYVRLYTLILPVR